MNPFLITIPSTDGVQVAVHDHGGDGPPMFFVMRQDFMEDIGTKFARHL